METALVALSQLHSPPSSNKLAGLGIAPVGIDKVDEWSEELGQTLSGEIDPSESPQYAVVPNSNKEGLNRIVQ